MRAQDVGCCFGQELRKAILDGYPEANVVASDLTSDYWCMMCPCSLHTSAIGACEQGQMLLKIQALGRVKGKAQRGCGHTSGAARISRLCECILPQKPG